MQINQPSTRIHPLMAGAAVSVMLVSMVGIAAITGIIPNSHATATENARVAAPSSTVAPVSAMAQPVPSAQGVHKEGSKRKTVMHNHPVQNAQVEPHPQYFQPSAHQQPAPPVAQNSPIGIGVGAVVGGLLGNQVGGGNGKTLATIAGALGGGYVGNEIAKRNP